MIVFGQQSTSQHATYVATTRSSVVQHENTEDTVDEEETVEELQVSMLG